MASVISLSLSENRKQIHKAFLLLLASVAILPAFRNHHTPEPNHSGMYAMVLLKKEGYDAKTGKWINKKPSASAFPISPETYEKVKNWYATDSGSKNPDNLPTEAPKEGYTYIYTPYSDPKHPNSVGMGNFGLEGYKGYWYADDLSKATDSVTDAGVDVPIPPPKDNSPATIAFGGYDARTGNWVNTEQSESAFPISSGQFERIKNWFSTNYGTNNPLNLPVQVPRDGFTYLFVPFNDPKHPGVVGMSFEGGIAYKGYWYADKIGPTKDTISTNNTNTQNTPPVVSPQQQATPPPKQDN
jgi:hypothetical protein